MLSDIKTVAKNIPGLQFLVDSIRRALSPIGVKLLDHRDDGDIFANESGSRQLDFLVSRGLRPDHHLVHVGCGSLRTGIHFIRYLDMGRYCGMEKERDLVQAGITKRLGLALFNSKRPLFIVTDRFAFECCDNRPDFALAQSLFVHLAPHQIRQCLENLRGRISDDGIFFATFAEATFVAANRTDAPSRESIYYTRSEMEDFGSRAGWVPTYLGESGYESGQMMMSYRPRLAS